jgi:hypothetical protein
MMPGSGRLLEARPLLNARFLPGALFSLGLGNVARKGVHSLGVRTRLHPAVRLSARPVLGPIFRATPGSKSQPWHPAWHGTWWAYGKPLPYGGPQPPDWHGALGQRGIDGEMAGWWEMPPLLQEVDVKDIWEFSRFDWVVCMAQRIACGDVEESTRLKLWLEDWCLRNPPYLGRNWQCGQEASIRVLHLAVAALLLQEHHEPQPALLELVEVHLRRIAATTGYAIAQQNNHASSEAAALFVGGSWLSRHRAASGRAYERAGRRLLEHAVTSCTSADGSLSQSSPTYQRLFLDTLSIAEVWRIRLGLSPLHPRVVQRIRASVAWLDAMVEPVTGDAPNLGGNDGAMLLPIGTSHYRNFKPSLHLAGALFGQAVSHPEDEASKSLREWLGVPAAASIAGPSTALFEAGGFAVVRGDGFHSVLRLPTFPFRPAHADALHLDLWVRGVNIIRDSGSFRYSGEEPEATWFPSTAAHSTVEFDGRPQMPRLGKFLFGAWLSPTQVPTIIGNHESKEITASYRDAWGASHSRHVRWEVSRLTVEDSVSGFGSRARLRWHLAPLDWSVQGSKLHAAGISISITDNGKPAAVRLGASPRSVHYGALDRTPMLEIESTTATRFRTTIAWDS